MNPAANSSTGNSHIAHIQARFLAVLPRIRTHARIYHRHIPCRVKRADAIQETIGLAWVWFARLIRQGKCPEKFVSTLASFAARAVRSGRRVCGQLKAKDVLSERAQRRHNFCVGKLPDHETLTPNPLTDALSETPDRDPSEIAAFMVDFPSWVKTHSRRDRRMIGDMMLGHRTLDLAKKFKLSPARISQRRAELKSDWETYTADPAEAA